MIIVFTGNGKGKTTASLGQAMRSTGRGKKVLMIQFIKGPWKSGEDAVRLKNFKLVKMGLGFVGILGDKLPRSKHREAAENALMYFKTELARGEWHTIILDEINVAVDLKLLRARAVLAALKQTPLKTFVVLTGRNAPLSFIKAAHLVTEMKDTKHPFTKGRLAEIALDF